MIGRIAAAGFLLLAAATPAAADAKSEALVRDFVAWVDSSDDVVGDRSASVRSDGSDTIAEGLIFSRKEPNVSINIERGPAGGPGRPARRRASKRPRSR